MSEGEHAWLVEPRGKYGNDAFFNSGFADDAVERRNVSTSRGYSVNTWECPWSVFQRAKEFSDQFLGRPPFRFWRETRTSPDRSYVEPWPPGTKKSRQRAKLQKRVRRGV